MQKKNKYNNSAPKELPLSAAASSTNWFSSPPFPQEEKKLSRWETVFIYLIFSGIFLLYFWTLAPSVPTGDSGELIASAFTLGIPHPPGYPLFNVLGKLFTYIPFGSIAWRVNLSSAVFNFLASVFIYLTLFKLIKYWPAALLAALFFATAPIIWEYSLKAEVFALNNFFAALILYLLLCSRELFLQHKALLISDILYQNKSRTLLYTTLFICGLALTNHQTIILLAPAVLLGLYFYQRANLMKPNCIVIALSAFLMGLAILIYIPLRARTHPYLNWDNPETLDSFLALILRKDYGTLTLMNLEGETYTFIDKCYFYFLSLIRQFTLVGVLLAITGALFIISQKDKKPGIILLSAFAFTSLFFISLANLIQGSMIFLLVFERFYMLPSILFALFIGLGVYFLHQRILRCVAEHQKKLNSYLINGSIALIILIAASLNFSKLNQRNVNLDYYLGYNLLNSLEKNAIFITNGDLTTHTLLYMQRVENIRTDITVFDTEMTTYPWYCNQFKQEHTAIKIPFETFNPNATDLLQLVNANIETHPIYVNTYFSDPRISTQYQLVRMGLIQKVIPKEIALNEEDYLKTNTKLWQSYHVSDVMRAYTPGSFESSISAAYAHASFDLAFQYEKMGLFDPALDAYNQAIHLNESSVPYAYKNAAIIYYNTKHQLEPALNYFKKYIQLVPNDEPKDEERNMILAFIEQHSKK